MEIQHGKLGVRPLSDEDAPWLHKWLNDPRVLAYYEGRDRPHDMAMVRQHFLGRTDINDVLGCLVTWDGVPVGYVQMYPISPEEHALYGYPDSQRVYGMDQFLGEPEVWNQGIGTQLVTSVAEWLRSECKADCVVMDPRTENARAIHVYEKCGFRKVKLLPQRELHEGVYHDCWLMELRFGQDVVMTSVMRFLGTSDAQGVPRLLCHCGVCQGGHPANQRRRPSVLFETPSHLILIDTSPDFREQYLQYGTDRVPDTVLITHAHNDHISGLGDFSDLAFWNHANSQVVSPADVTETLLTRYPYLTRRDGLTFVSANELTRGDWHIRFHRVAHGFNGYSYGIVFTCGSYKWAYVSDAFDVSDTEWEPFRDCDVLILGTSYWNEQHSVRSRRSVYDVQEALKLRRQLNPGRLVLTHLSHDVDVPTHAELLPEGVEFAYDGMTMVLPAPSPSR